MNNGQKFISIIIDDSRIKFTDECLDVTFIEIKPRKDRINQFLDINEEIETNSEYKYNKKSIYTLHYPKGTEINVSYGLILEKYKKDYLKHLCNTEEGSSGAPILLLDSLKVIAIHNGGENRRGFHYNYAILINSAIEKLNNNNNNIVDNKEDKKTRYNRNKLSLNNINNSIKYKPESYKNNVNNLNSDKNNDMENNYTKNQMNMNNMSNNKISLNEIKITNNNNILNNMKIIDHNNFYRINQINYTNNQMNNFVRMNQNVNFSLIRLNMEFKLCCKDECLNTIVSNFRLDNGDLYKWKVDMIGPIESPYEGGLFTILIIFPEDYPKHGPEFKILNKIYHPNVDPKVDIGHISMSRLNSWRNTGKVYSMPGYNVKNALFDIFYLIGKCGDIESPYDDEMAMQLRHNPEKFHKIAKEWTKKYASL